MEASSRAVTRCFMFVYFSCPTGYRSYGAAGTDQHEAELPSRKLPTIQVQWRISRFSRSITLLVRTRGPVFTGEIAVG